MKMIKIKIIRVQIKHSELKNPFTVRNQLHAFCNL